MVFARDVVERLAVVRLLVELELAFADPELFLAVLVFAVLAFAREFDLAAAGLCVTAARSLSKSLSACLLVFDASRRSATSAAVTSL